MNEHLHTIASAMAVCLASLAVAASAAAPAAAAPDREEINGRWSDRARLTGQAEAPDAAPLLWYRSPAGAWEEALPIGNGRLGAMVFGGVAEDVCLNVPQRRRSVPDGENAPFRARRREPRHYPEGSARVWGVKNSFVEARRRDKLMETADDGRQREVIWEMSANPRRAEHGL